MNTVLAERVLPTSQTIQIVRGDLTAETTDAIVNAANEHLLHGAGVAGAIVRRGGMAIQQESNAWVRQHGLVSHARPAWTSGGLLPAKYVIHAVGPVWGDGDEDAKLSAAVHGALEIADELKLVSLALPAISTGIFGFPKERAAHVMLSTIHNYFSHHASGIALVRLVLFDEATIKAFMSEWESRKLPEAPARSTP
jgi:O-acetyl-ADP-ribose deacetylase (regulator of RNase III)